MLSLSREDVIFLCIGRGGWGEEEVGPGKVSVWGLKRLSAVGSAWALGSWHLKSDEWTFVFQIESDFGGGSLEIWQSERYSKLSPFETTIS